MTTTYETHPHGRPGLSVGWWPVLLAIVIGGVVVVWALGGLRPPPGPVGASVGSILGQPGEFIGSEVVVSGRVDGLLTERAVTIGSDLVDGSLLVVLRDEVTEPAAAAVGVPARVGQTFVEGDVAQLTGEIRTFAIAPFQEDFGLVLNEELFGPFEGQPALAARAISLTTLGEPPVVAPERVTVATLMGAPHEWAGLPVIVSGHVGERIDESALLLTGEVDGDGLVVVGQPSSVAAADELGTGAAVEVEGTLWAFDRDLVERETGLSLDAIAYADLDGRPTVLAEDIRPAD